MLQMRLILPAWKWISKSSFVKFELDCGILASFNLPWDKVASGPGFKLMLFSFQSIRFALIRVFSFPQ